jgi:SAM-dependent methyltransferase
MHAALYHAHHAPYQEDLPFWMDLAAHYGNPVLELGCGTGRVLLPLLRRGVRAFGLDRDRTMLAYLQQLYRADFPPVEKSPPVFQADMTGFHLEMSFALILLPCNTLSSLPEADRGCLYERVAAHLAPGGAFAFSIANPRLLLALPRRSAAEVEESFIHPLSGNPVQVSSAWHREAGRFVLAWHYDHLLPDGRVERHSVETRHTLQPAEAYAAELAAAGLRLAASWGDFDRSEYHVDAPYWIALAEPAG